MTTRRSSLAFGSTTFAWQATAAWTVALLVHPVLDWWASSQVQIRDAIARNVPVDSVLVANSPALRKFIDDLARPYVTLHRSHVSADELERLGARHGSYFVALLDRTDSDYWRRDAAANAAFIAQLGNPEPLVDVRATATDRLRIWRIDAEPR